MHPERTSTDLLTYTYYRDLYFDFTYVANQLVHVMKESFTFELSTHYMDCEMCYVRMSQPCSKYIDASNFISLQISTYIEPLL